MYEFLLFGGNIGGTGSYSKNSYILKTSLSDFQKTTFDFLQNDGQTQIFFAEGFKHNHYFPLQKLPTN